MLFPNTTAAQREKGLTDFNDLAVENPRLAKHQLEEAVWRARQQSEEQTGEIGKGMLRLNSWAGRREITCEILKETPHRFLVRLGEDCLFPGGRQGTKGQDVYLPKDSMASRCVVKGNTLEVREKYEASFGTFQLAQWCSVLCWGLKPRIRRACWY